MSEYCCDKCAEESQCMRCGDREVKDSQNGYCVPCWNEMFHPELNHCPGCDDEITVGANGYCGACWTDRFGCEDLSPIEHEEMIDFLSLGYSPDEHEMLADAYRAIEKAKMWEYMKQEPSGGGYTFTDDEELRSINRYIEYTGHSGSSFSWAMRTMQLLARKGETVFIQECKESFARE
jgi:hypothetical protein